MKKFLVSLLVLLLATGVAYGASTKLEDENGVGAIRQEDEAHVSGQPGIQALTVRKNTAAAVSGTDGDYQPLITDTNGRLHVIDVSTTAINTTAAAINTNVDKVNGTATSINTNVGLVNGTLASIKTAVEIMDDWDTSNLCNVNIGGRSHGNVSIIAKTTLDDSPTSVASAGLPVGEYSKIGFYILYEEVGTATISGNATIDVAVDNTTFVDSTFFNAVGNRTSQWFQTMATNGTYIIWLDPEVPVEFLHLDVVATGTDADGNISNITAWMVYQR